MKQSKWLACLLVICLLSGCAFGSTESSTQAEPQLDSAVATTVAPDSEGGIRLDDVLAWMKQDDAERAKLSGSWVDAYGGDTRIKEIKQVNDRYQAKVVRTAAVTASEEEMKQARQTGYIVLKGTQYCYTNSQEQFDAWMQEQGLESVMSVPETGIILEDKEELSSNDLFNGSFYEVAKVGKNYIFAYGVGGLSWRIQETVEEAWIWLDGDMPLEEGPVWSEDRPEGGYTLATYLQNHSIAGKICRFDYRDNEPIIWVDAR